MTPRQSRILLAASAWTLYVWISRAVILAGQDGSASFKVVHFVLAAVSIAFGLAVGWIGLTARRSQQEASRQPVAQREGVPTAQREGAPTAQREGIPPPAASS
jgi:hypothetical protein